MQNPNPTLPAFPFPPALRRLAAVAALAGLAACTAADGTSEYNDPYEAQNRQVHALNLALDRAVVRPGATAYGTAVPPPVRRGVSNFAANLNLPGQIANNLLQGRVDPAIENTFRFVVNTTVGIGGLFDPATAIGIAGQPTDFGETLHVWGAPEGAYLELPLLGPSTERDLAGKVVDLALNPLNFVLESPEMEYALGVRVLSRFGDRYRYSDLVDSILYDSADSYAQARLLYLQNRRYELGSETEADAYDPYEDPYDQ